MERPTIAHAESLEKEQVPLFRFALFLSQDRPAAEEISQETLTIAVEKLRRTPPQGEMGKWLRGIARNVYLKARTRRRLLPMSGEVLEQAERFWERRVGAEREESPYLAALRECLEFLGEDDRKMLDIRYRDNPRREALANILGISVEALESRLKRARRQLKQCVEGKVANSA